MLFTTIKSLYTYYIYQDTKHAKQISLARHNVIKAKECNKRLWLNAFDILLSLINLEQ